MFRYSLNPCISGRMRVQLQIYIYMILLYTYIQIVALAVNESGRFEITFGNGCTRNDQCRWTDMKVCFDGCGSESANKCKNVDYDGDLLPLRNKTKAGNGAALAFNIIGLLLLTVAIIVLFIKSIQDKIGKYIRIMVGISALCSLIAIIAMAGGNAGKNQCWDDDPTIDIQYNKSSASPGGTFYVEIVVFILLIITTILIHIGYGVGGSTN